MADNTLIFASSISPGLAELEAIVLARSIRTFAGRFSESPIWFLRPEAELGSEQEIESQLHDLDALLIPYNAGKAVLAFPFGRKVLASASAEKLAEPLTDILVWMDVDSIVLNEPLPLILENQVVLGYRPVDHTLIGSPFDAPIDPFWERIYRRCQVSDADLFPMTTSVDMKTIRPYFNAGMLAVRPKRRLLRLWRDRFLDNFLFPPFKEFYAANILYKIFIHQAVLAGVVLSVLDREEIAELPPTLNYPLHMHGKYPASSRPSHIDELLSCRYDTLFQDQEWRGELPAREPFASWLDDQVRLLST
jgi:hypothetical protein